LFFLFDNKWVLDFWDRVTKLIESQNTKQVWLAEKAGVLQQTLSQWIIKDRLPDVEEAYKIAIALEVTLEYLVTGSPPEGIPPMSSP
jgi:transcriptional regulator with XRE-family HTH domain